MRGGNGADAEAQLLHAVGIEQLRHVVDGRDAGKGKALNARGNVKPVTDGFLERPDGIVFMDGIRHADERIIVRRLAEEEICEGETGAEKREQNGEKRSKKLFHLNDLPDDVSEQEHSIYSRARGNVAAKSL